MLKFELVDNWKEGKVKEGIYTSYTLEDGTNIIVKVEEECITFEFLEGRFTRCETYYKDGTVEEYFE